MRKLILLILSVAMLLAGAYGVIVELFFAHVVWFRVVFAAAALALLGGTCSGRISLHLGWASRPGKTEADNGNAIFHLQDASNNVSGHCRVAPGVF
jgi:hypothetical protein